MKLHVQKTPVARGTYQRVVRERKALASLPKHRPHDFVNPFHIEDLLVFDETHLCRVLADENGRLTPEQLAWCVQRAPAQLVQRILACLSNADQAAFLHTLASPITSTAGEHLHPGIFEQLEPWLQGKIVLDIGAGSGRASSEALHHGAKLVYAVEPSPGLRHILRRKLARAPNHPAMLVSTGDFAHVPLPAQSVDLALSCSAFTAKSEQGGEPGLAELRRVTRTGGIIAIIWPRPHDRAWFSQHGFRYVALPCEQTMRLAFASWQSAWRCVRRFYGENQAALRHLLYAHEPSIPFTMLGLNAPCDYCWLRVE